MAPLRCRSRAFRGSRRTISRWVVCVLTGDRDSLLAMRRCVDGCGAYLGASRTGQEEQSGWRGWPAGAMSGDGGWLGRVIRIE